MSLQNAWYAACESRSLKRSPLAITLFGKGLVLWRDEAGQAQAFADSCPHRSAPLSAGKVKAGCLVCPYHGWEFHPDGSCVKIPSLSGKSEIPAPNVALNSSTRDRINPHFIRRRQARHSGGQTQQA